MNLLIYNMIVQMTKWEICSGLMTFLDNIMLFSNNY